MSARMAVVVGGRLRCAREAAGLTKADLASLVGKTHSTVSGWESGRRSPRLDDLVRLIAVLSIDPAALLAAPESGGGS